MRGVVAAALVDGSGEVVASRAEPGVLDQLQLTTTSALAAAEAFSDLFEDASRSNLTAIYDDGQPLLFAPVPDSDMTLVVALASAADIGRARFQLRRLTGVKDAEERTEPEESDEHEG